MSPILEKLRVAVLLVLAMLVGPADSSAQEENQGRSYRQLVNELVLTRSVYPQEEGEVQLTLLPFLSDGETDRAAVPFAVEYGLSDRLQVELEWIPLMLVKPDGDVRSGSIGDMEVSAQYSFMSIGGSSFHAALALGAAIPTGDLEKGTTEGFIEYESSLALAKDFGALDGLQLFGEVALALVDRVKHHADPAEAEPAAHELSVGVGILAPFRNIRFLLEVNWATNRWNNEGEESEAYLSPGFIWDLPGTWEVGVGAPLGINDEADSARLVLVLLYEFELEG